MLHFFQKRLSPLVMGLCLVLLNLVRLEATTTWVPSGLIAENQTDPGYIVSCAYDPLSQQVVAAWPDANNHPHYATFDGTTWTDQGTMTTSSTVLNSWNLYVSYDGGSGKLIAIWVDGTSGHLQYAAFNGISWSYEGSFATNNYPNDPVIFSCYDPGSSQFIAAWSDGSSACYATYDGTSWSEKMEITSSSVPFYDVFLCYDAHSNQMVATWMSGSLHPCFATYDGASWTYQGEISSAYTCSSVDVFCSYNPISGQLIAAWSDNNQLPHYATYDGTSWTDHGSFSSSAGAVGNIFSLYDPNSGLVVATWADQSTFPHFATFDGETWTDGGEIETASEVFQDVFTAYNPQGGKVVATWQNSSNHPYFAATFFIPRPTTALDLESIQTVSIETLNQATSLLSEAGLL